MQAIRRIWIDSVSFGFFYVRLVSEVVWTFLAKNDSQKEMVWESTERNLKLDGAFALSRFEGVAINEHFLLKASFSTLRGETCASTQHWWSLTHIASKFKIYAWKSGGSFLGFDFRCTTDFTFPKAGWKPNGAPSPGQAKRHPGLGYC